MPKFTWKWFWEKIFDEFEARDFLAVLVAILAAMLIFCKKFPAEESPALFAAFGAYLLGRPRKDPFDFGGKKEAA